MNFKNLKPEDIPKLSEDQLIEWGRDMYRRLARSGKRKKSLKEWHTMTHLTYNCPWCEISERRRIAHHKQYLLHLVETKMEDLCMHCPIEWPFGHDNDRLNCGSSSGLFRQWEKAVFSGNKAAARQVARQISRLPLREKNNEE